MSQRGTTTRRLPFGRRLAAVARLDHARARRLAAAFIAASVGALPAAQSAAASPQTPAGPSSALTRFVTGQLADIGVTSVRAGFWHSVALADDGTVWTWGDNTYGPGFKTKATLLPENAREALAALGRQALHAHILGFQHPDTCKILSFKSRLPDDLTRLRSALLAGATVRRPPG